MLQRRALLENISTVNCPASRPGAINIKVTVKERKAAKRKEKSRVAAQIRRNKESQTLILLQNALPLALPSPSQMLEKSIVIRIAGQTLFLMNTLDQVLGMDGWLTIPLASNNFLTFFMDGTGQIVYASPNIQSLLEQYHWSNLIGMSIYDVIDFKSRWPIVGEAVRMRLSTTTSIATDTTSFISSLSSTNSQLNCPRTAIASRLNLKKSSQGWNNSSSTCSLYNVWCCANINHTNLKLKLLILQAVQIKSSVLHNINSQHETSKHILVSTSATMSLERSISWPSISSSTSPVKREQLNPGNCIQNDPDNSEHVPNSLKCIYQNMISSAHDKYYNFKSAGTEFCQLIGESPNSLIDLNFLDIIHLEDVIKVKSFLDLIIENNDSHIWTPIYRIMGRNGHQCVVKTLAKQYCTNTTHSLILNHLLIETSQNVFNIRVLNERNRTYNSYENSHRINKTPKKDMILLRSDPESCVILKRKSNDTKGTVDGDKYARLVDRTLSGPVVFTNSLGDQDQSRLALQKTQQLHTNTEDGIANEMLDNDPFLPMDLERSSTFNRKCRKDVLTSFNDHNVKIVNPPTYKNQLRKFDNVSNRSPSYSLESYVLTSPGSESTDVPPEDQFIWDVTNSFQEMSQLSYWLDDQCQHELESILPI